jgi:glycosyl transferase family 87
MATEAAEARTGAAAPAAPAPGASARGADRALGLAALGLLALAYAALAVLFAAPGSRVVLATAGGSPDWLLGPFRTFGAGFADGDSAGPLFYAGLWIALAAYVGVLAAARSIGPRLAISAICAFHVLFLLAPPLLSQDVFSYISYARLDVLHSLNPYTHSPDAVPGDAVYGFAGSKDATSAYGPLFTLATLPLAKLGVPTAFWTLKAVAALASLGVVALTWGCARRLGRDPVLASLAVGLNPLVLVHVVAGAHNDALVMLPLMGAIFISLPSKQMPSAGKPTAGSRAGRQRASTAGVLSAAAVGVKASGVLPAPFMLIGSSERGRFLAGAAAALGIAAAAAVAAFGTKALEAFVLIGQNQERTTRWSVPQRLADGIGAITGGSAGEIVHFTRAALVGLLAIALVALLRRAWLARDEPRAWVAAAGWATLGVLLATAWLVPWYAIWLLPLAALARDVRLLAGAIALCAYMLVIAVPL